LKNLSKYHKIFLSAILFLSVAVRVTVALYLGNVVDAPPLLTDQRSYHGLGARLIAGRGFSFDRNWYPFTTAETPTAHWSFLYSLFVAAVYALLGVHPLAVRLVQALLGGVLLPWVVCRLARTTFALAWPGERARSRSLALLSALFAALYPYFVLYAATLMTETFYLVAVVVSLERALVLAGQLRDGSKSHRIWPLGIELGLSLGVAALLRQSILPWVPVLFLYLLWEGGRSLLKPASSLRAALGALSVGGLALLAMILPWTLRNYLVYGDFLLLNSNTGYAMYSAQHPMHGVRFREYDAAPLPKEYWGRAEPELERILMREALGFVRAEPGRYLLLSLSRVRAYFEFWPTRDTTLLHNVGRTCSFGLLLPVLVWGLYLALKEPGFMRRNLLLFAFAVLYTALHLLTWATVRYRLPVDVALMPIAAWGTVDLARRAWGLIHLRQRRLDSEPAGSVPGGH
jgi:hypothetical protein